MERITAVHAESGNTLFVTYQDGLELQLDLSPLLEKGGVFAALREQAAFERVRPGARGRSITWDNDLEIDVDALRLPEGHPDKPDGTRELNRTQRPMTPVALELARALRESGLTQKQLEQRSGIAQQNISRMLQPDYNGHTVQSLERLAGAMGKRLVLRLEDGEHVQ